MILGILIGIVITVVLGYLLIAFIFHEGRLPFNLERLFIRRDKNE